MYTILSKNIESSTKEAMLALYQGKLAEYGDYLLVHGDVRVALPDVPVDDSFVEVTLGTEEGQTDVASFLSEIGTLMTSDLSDQLPLLMNHPCAVAIVEAFFTTEEELP